MYTRLTEGTYRGVDLWVVISGRSQWAHSTFCQAGHTFGHVLASSLFCTSSFRGPGLMQSFHSP
ncbi:unnamed protein product [Protopolystoma xenopodis]|uniref:Uncharacterized protein n=1 Tax=Protopolystoma xenopodis TaxID=117903 RepID=A0A448WMI2_9PLAT|nr:unnamed protein product [Protopolystoma xenopodis]